MSEAGQASAGQLIARGAEELQRAGIPNGRLESEILLRHALGCPRDNLLGRLAEPVPPKAARLFFEFLERRRSRVPLQYLTGVQEFWGLEFRLTPAVLIPRPETEGVVEAALARLRGRAARVADVGCGSGCIAVALARELPGAQIYALDISSAALAVARENADRHGVSSRVHFLQGDLLAPLAGMGLRGSLDAVVSNPPYLAEEELDTLQPEVREHEPHAALSAGRDGLEVVRRLIPEAATVLGRGGYLILEIGINMESRVRALLEAGTSLAWESTIPDLQGIPRVLVARKPLEERMCS